MVRRVASVVLAALLVMTSCSLGDDGTGGSDTGASTDGSDTVLVDADDPTALLCGRWAGFAELMDAEEEPSDELIDEILERQRGIDEVVPDELTSAWRDIVDWNMAFIEFFGAAGYQEVSEDVVITIFGDEEAANDAADAVEAGFQTMRDWSDANCTTGGGDATAFCLAWTDISDLLERLDEEPPTEELVDELFAAHDDADPDVPAEIRDHWDALFAFAAPFRDVLVTVEYDLGRVSEDLLAEAFGSLDDAQVLEEAAEAGEAAIDAWSLEGCGDFCARWDETREAIDQLGANHYLGWVHDMGEEGSRQLGLMQSRVDVATRLLPVELAADWAELEVLLSDWSEWWAAFGFDGSRMDTPEADEARRELAERAAYFDDLVVEHWGMHEEDLATFLADLRASPDSPMADVWMEVVPQGIAATRDRIDAWVDDNCDVAGGRPGRIRVTWPAIEGEAGNTIVVAVMRPDATIDELGHVDRQEAGYCEGIGRDPWGYELDPEGNRHPWGSDWFRGERHGGGEGTLCDFAWEEGGATLDAGRHTLLAALVPGGVQGRTLSGPPTVCLALAIEIDGDTEIQLPQLPACDADLADLVVDPEPWRTPESVDPSPIGSGTLRVTVPSLVLPDDIEAEHGGELTIVVLPAGTTLNEIGREEVWPSGGFRTHLELRGDQPHIEELERLGAVAVPIMAVPANGVFGHFEPWWLHEAEPAQLPLTVLAPGDYDVHVQVSGHSEGGEDKRCGRTTVTIDGDTVVDMAELGECP